MWNWFLNKVKSAIEDEILLKIKMHQKIYNVGGDFIIKGDNMLLQHMMITTYRTGPGITIYGNKNSIEFLHNPCAYNLDYSWNGKPWYPLNIKRSK
jgi:hypothetical protein